MQVSSTVSITDLNFANDMALLEDSLETVREAVKGVGPYAAVVDLWIYAAKTKVLSAKVTIPQQRLHLLKSTTGRSSCIQIPCCCVQHQLTGCARNQKPNQLRSEGL